MKDNIQAKDGLNKCWHTSSQPFENISSMRAHFVQSFSNDCKMTEEDLSCDEKIILDYSKNEDILNANSGKNISPVFSGNHDLDIFKSSPKHFPTNLAFSLGKFEDDEESGLGILSPDTTTQRTFEYTNESCLTEFDSEKTIEGGLHSLDYTADVELLEIDLPHSVETKVVCLLTHTPEVVCEIQTDAKNVIVGNTTSSQSSLPSNLVAAWMQPLMSTHCLHNKDFWNSPLNETCPSKHSNESEISSSDISPSSETSRMSCPPRSPLSIVKSLSPTDSVQSLPSSPMKAVRSVSVRKLTSESFSSENDISRSLEIVYVEPELDPKETFSAQYRTNSPLYTENTKFEKRKASFTQLKRPPSNELRSDSPEKENMSESDIPSSASPDFFEFPKVTSAEFTPYVSDVEPLMNKKLTSPTKIIAPYTSSSPVQHVVSNEILSPILDIQSQTPLRSPEKKFEYVQGNPLLALAHRLGSP